MFALTFITGLKTVFPTLTSATIPVPQRKKKKCKSIDIWYSVFDSRLPTFVFSLKKILTFHYGFIIAHFIYELVLDGVLFSQALQVRFDVESKIKVYVSALRSLTTRGIRSVL